MNPTPPSPRWHAGKRPRRWRQHHRRRHRPGHARSV